MDIILKSTSYQIVGRTKKTAAQGWKDLRTGDTITFSFKVDNNSGGGHHGRLYQSYILVQVFRQGRELQSFYVSLSMINHYMDMFVIQECKE